MKKILVLLSLLYGHFASAQIESIKGTFLQKEIGIFTFSPTESSFSSNEIEIINSWLLSKTKTLDKNLRYENLNLYFDIKKNSYETTTGCFTDWFNSLDNGNRIPLMAYFSNTDFKNLTNTQIQYLSDSFNKYTNDNSENCRKSPLLNDPLYISLGLNEYLSYKLQNVSYDVRYGNILDKTFKSITQKLNLDSAKLLKNWLDSMQNDFISISPDLIYNLINNLTITSQNILNETEFTFKFISNTKKFDVNFINIIDNDTLVYPYIKASKYIFDACSEYNKFLLLKCNSRNYQKTFYFIQLKRSNDKYYNDIFIFKL